MAKALSADLRRRVVDAVDAGAMEIGSAALKLSISDCSSTKSLGSTSAAIKKSPT